MPTYALRGIGFNRINLSATSTVGTYADEVAYAYPIINTGPLIDIERVQNGTRRGPDQTGASRFRERNFRFSLPSHAFVLIGAGQVRTSPDKISSCMKAFNGAAGED